MEHSKDSGLRPRNGHTLIVGIVARISGCSGQKEISLQDQIDHGKDDIGALYKGVTDYEIVATKGKGEWLDRPELAKIEATIRERRLDVLFVEDVGRLARSVDAVRLCGIAVDHGTRFISAHDCIDTVNANWEEEIISACRDHVNHQNHTSKRIKGRLEKRFKRSGGATAREIYGYIKPDGATTYDEWLKDPESIAIMREWYRRLRESLNCSAVADWLNEQKVPTGKYARKKTWDGKMVRRITRNPILMGMPGRGFRHTVKHNESGHRKSQKNPEGPTFWEAPHLAHWDAAEFHELNALLERNNDGLGRKPINGLDPLFNVPRKRTRFPGQHSVCWYCGYQHVWGGNGMTDNLMCKRSREWGCWNSIGFNGGMAAARIAEAVSDRLGHIDGFDKQLRALAEEAMRAGNDLDHEWQELRRDEAALESEEKNLTEAVAKFGPKDMFLEKLNELEATKRHLAMRRRSLEGRTGRPVHLPAAAGLRELFREKMRGLAVDSSEFGELLRRVAPEMHVYQIRLLDGGHLISRARVALDPAGMVPDAADNLAYRELLRQVVTIDLFDPPCRERIRPESVRLAAVGLNQRQIAQRLKVTQTEVWKALALERLMRERGLDSPYVVVMEPPDDYTKLRRHKNAKYLFRPAEGYTQPPI